MKIIVLKILSTLLLLFLAFSIRANVIITAATGGSSLCSGITYSPLGPIVITESSNSDIADGQSGATLILTAPSGYEFQTGVGSVSFTGSANLSAVSISIAQYTITVTFSSNGTNKHDDITISGIYAKASNSTPLASSGYILRTVANPGTGTITGSGSPINPNYGTLTQAAAMTYSSSTVTQTNLTNAGIGSIDEEIISIQVVVTGECSPLSATSFTLSTNGSTNPVSDITDAKLYYTSASSTYSTTTLFGSSASPNGSFIITGTALLISGTNYFWLAYDISSGSSLKNIIDGECSSISISGNSHTPSPTHVTGCRIISRCPTGFMENGSNIVTNGDFSSGNSGFTSEYTYVADNPLIQTELVPEGYYSVGTRARDFHPNFSSSTKGHGGGGNFMIINGNTIANRIVWQETVGVSTNTNYYFCAWLCSVNPSNPANLQFSVNGATIGTDFTASSDTSNHWDEFYATWDSKGYTSAIISIVNKNIIASGNDFGLDDISFVPCTENELPMELIYFNANAICDEIKLNWITASETNNEFYTIERSVDGITFAPIGNVKGAGNSNEILYYYFTDKNPLTGLSYYRLKQTDLDGKFSFSDVVAVKMNERQTTKVELVNNNGTVNLIINSPSEADADVSFFDICGRITGKETIHLIKGENKTFLNTKPVKGNIFFIVLNIEGGREIYKFKSFAY